jgi:O-antigen/teichoic acid export membrane protein
MALSSGMRWSGISIVGREGARMVFTIILARLVGPESFGIFAQASVYIGIVGLLLDQGFSSALIQRPRVAEGLPGAILSVNLAVGALLAGLTVAIAPAWAGFMNSPELTLVLTLLAPTLLIRAACVTPRALLLRHMEFRKIAIADVTAAVAGGALGVLAAELGAGYWALVVQIVSTDATLLLALLVLRVIPWPNLQLWRLQEVAAFAGRTFAAGSLATVSRNIDNVLVGKFQGAEALAFYGLGYRLLLLPIQLLTGTIGNVLFPAFSRLADDMSAIRSLMIRATRALASIALPAMSLAAAAAPQLVVVLFGTAWEPAVPIVQVLAIAGGVQAVYQPSSVPMMLGLGHAKLGLRLALLAEGVIVAGIVAGLPFSPLAVAIGYTSATLALVPADLLVRRYLLGLTLLSQVKALVPGVHVALWMAAAYTVVATVADRHELVALVLGVSVALGVGFAVLRVAHQAQLTELVHMASRMLGRTGPGLVAVENTGGAS